MAAAAQSWIENPAANYGLVILEKSSSGAVYASFCSELGWCGAGTQPKLTITYTTCSALSAARCLVRGEPGCTLRVW